MKLKYIVPPLMFALLTTFVACDNEEAETFVREIVVSSAMYVGQPMTIKLSHTIPWNEYYNYDEVIIEGATVVVSTGGVDYPLTEANSGLPGCYRAANDAPPVTTGEQYELRVEFESTVITATTTCAGAIEITETNVDPNDQAMPDTFEYGERVGNTVLTPFIRWTTDERNRGYAMLLENLEPDWSEDYRELGTDNGPCSLPVSAFVFVDLDSLNLPNVLFCASGLHRARILSCDQALFDYIQTTYLGEPENYPISNLSAGQGAFWAGDADTVYFYITDDVED